MTAVGELCTLRRPVALGDVAGIAPRILASARRERESWGLGWICPNPPAFLVGLGRCRLDQTFSYDGKKKKRGHSLVNLAFCFSIPGKYDLHLSQVSLINIHKEDKQTKQAGKKGGRLRRHSPGDV